MPPGAQATRLVELLDEAKERCKGTIKERRGDDISDEELEESSSIMGYGGHQIRRPQKQPQDRLQVGRCRPAPMALWPHPLYEPMLPSRAEGSKQRARDLCFRRSLQVLLLTLCFPRE